jgi:ketosteroid isomerase-like protein
MEDGAMADAAAAAGSEAAGVAQTLAVGKRLVELCQQGKNRAAIEELYDDDAVSIEAMEGGPNPRTLTGKPAILAASDQFFETMEVHDSTMDGPYPHDDEFICFATIDLTPKDGPMAGQRMQASEACRYKVADGKITHAWFYYDPGC